MPTLKSVHVDRLLDSIVVATKQSLTEFVADKLFPFLPAEKESDKFGRYAPGTYLRRPTANPAGIIRQLGDTYPKANFAVTDDDFKCHQYGLELPLDDRTKRQADAAYDLENVPVELLTYHVMREREFRAKALATSTAVVTQNVTLAGVSQFDDVNSDPVSVIETGCEAILTATGMLPNIAMIPWQVWTEGIKHHPDLLDRLKYTFGQKKSVGPEGFFDIFSESFAPGAELVVPKVIYDSSKEGAAATSNGFLWPKDILLAYVDPTPVKERVTFGYTFENERLHASRRRDDSKDSDVSRVTEIVGEKVIENTCAYLIKDATSA